MKVLDPQSALLSNAEVYQFLKTRPPTVPEKKAGAYPVTNLTGHQAVLKDLNSYVEEVTPHVKQQVDINDWIVDLVRKLKPFGLTKTEVMNLINLGVGIRPLAQPEHVNGEAEGDQEADPEREMDRYVQDFQVVVEEIDARFPGEEGEEQIRQIITALKEGIMQNQAET